MFQYALLNKDLWTANKHVEIFSIRKMLIKTSITEHSHTGKTKIKKCQWKCWQVWLNCKLIQSFWRTVKWLFLKVNLCLLCIPVDKLLALTQNTAQHMSIKWLHKYSNQLNLIIINWKDAKCSSVGECMNRVCGLFIHGILIRILKFMYINNMTES